MKISVVMPSFLGFYNNAASDRVEKFHRAVKSFKNQSHHEKELIVVSDGCEKTEEEFFEITEMPGYDKFKKIKETSGGECVYSDDDFPQYKLVAIKKQKMFSGEVRNRGVAEAEGIIVSYLDSDDYLLSNHLSQIAWGFGNSDWVYFNDHVPENIEHTRYSERDIDFIHGRIGTSCIAHRQELGVKWQDGYGHDFGFIYLLKEKYKNYKRIYGCGYIVCHVPGVIDF